MTQKLYTQIIEFSHRVGEYIRMEYDAVYYDNFNSNNLHMFDFIGSYYMMNTSVPDTAKYVVELMKMNQG